MHPTIETLLARVEQDPLPAEHTSSHWHYFGRRTLVQRQGDTVRLHAEGFETIQGHGLSSRLLQPVERWSYGGVTRRYRYYRPIWRLARRLVREVGGRPTFNAFKNACVLAVLAEYWLRQDLSPKTVVVIGDGQGLLGALIRRYRPGVRLYSIDLPKPLVFQASLHQAADPDATMAVLGATSMAEAADIVFAAPQEIEQIPDIDCAVNVASMQEMTPDSIARYFTFLRRRSRPQSHFYCVNRVQKELPGGKVIRFEDYPWQPADAVWLDEACPYYTHFLAPYTTPNGPRLWDRRLPWINAFDGMFWHRLVHLAPAAAGA